MLTEAILLELRATKSAAEWNAICDRIKAANGGQYPDDWYQKVILSGLAGRAQANWR